MFIDDIKGSLWDYLEKRKGEKKIILYGMGNGADKIKNALDDKGIEIADVMASDDFVRGHSYLGKKVKTLSEIEELYGGDFIILVSFGTDIPEVMEKIYEINGKYELYAPSVPVAGDGLFDLEFVKAHIDEIKKAYSLLADDQSRKAYENVIRYKLSGKLHYLREIETPREEAYDILNINNEEIYADIGAYNGDTIAEFLVQTGSNFVKIYAMEPEHRNYLRLKRRFYMLGSAMFEAYNCGAWDSETEMEFYSESGRGSSMFSGGRKRRVRTETVKMMSVDYMLQGEKATFIKYDVEGCEEKAIRGSEKTISEYRPKLAAAVYHRNEDIFALPLLINGISKRYKMYLRHHPYIPDWETNIYCI